MPWWGLGASRNPALCCQSGGPGCDLTIHVHGTVTLLTAWLSDALLSSQATYAPAFFKPFTCTCIHINMRTSQLVKCSKCLVRKRLSRLKYLLCLPLQEGIAQRGRRAAHLALALSAIKRSDMTHTSNIAGREGTR